MYSGDIAAFIEKMCEGRRINKYIEPFCGWCSVIARVVGNGKLGAKEFVASDYNMCIVQMWRGLSQGTWQVPKRVISKQEWEKLRDAPPSPLKAFAGVVYSYNGRYFNSYRAPHHLNTHGLQERANLLKQVRFSHKKYDHPDYLQAKGCVFYLDPPYQSRAFEYRRDTNKGEIVTPTFDHARFWDVARRLAKHNVVIVSEYQAPRDWRCVATLAKRSVKTKKNCVDERPEKLFMHRGPAPPRKPSPRLAQQTKFTVTRSGLRPLWVRKLPPPPVG